MVKVGFLRQMKHQHPEKEKATVSPHGPPETWIMTADAENAHIYRNIPGKGLEKLRSFSPAPPAEPASGPNERIGRNRAPQTGHHGLSPDRENVEEAEHDRFARQVMQELELEAENDNYAQLVIVSEPHFMGHLRYKSGPHVQKRIVHEIDKDLVKADPKRLENEVRDFMYLG